LRIHRSSARTRRSTCCVSSIEGVREIVKRNAVVCQMSSQASGDLVRSDLSDPISGSSRTFIATRLGSRHRARHAPLSRGCGWMLARNLLLERRIKGPVMRARRGNRGIL
jgi:hypothetical protein